MGYRDKDLSRKRSWKEIDKGRDRSSYRRQAGRDQQAREETFRSERAKQQYLKEADKLFSGKKQTPKDQSDAMAAIHKTFGTPKFKTAVRKYVGEYGLPEDWRTLVLLTDFEDPEVAEKTLEAMKSQYPVRSPQEQRAFISKLRILSMASKDPDLGLLAGEILQELQE